MGRKILEGMEEEQNIETTTTTEKSYIGATLEYFLSLNFSSKAVVGQISFQ